MPEVLKLPGFRLFLFGIVFSQIGSRATVVASLYQIYLLTNSSLTVGLTGIFDLLALLVLSPLGGVFADRLDRRRLIQVTQGVALVVSLGLAVLTLTKTIQPWHIYIAVLLTSASQTFDGPARQALIPSLVPRELLVQAFAIVNPSRELSILIGPAIAGMLMLTAAGPGAVYIFDAVTYGALIAALTALHLPYIAPSGPRAALWSSVGEGFAFVRSHAIIWQLISLDLAATIFGGYRALLPTISRDILGVGTDVYGILSSTPSAGALVGSALLLRYGTRWHRGAVVLIATAGYGAAGILLGQSSNLAPHNLGLALFLVPAFAATFFLGFFDAWATTVRQAVVQGATPDELRGRVTSTYQIASRGGPSIGTTLSGALATAFSAPVALTIAPLVPIVYAFAFFVRGKTVRNHR